MESHYCLGGHRILNIHAVLPAKKSSAFWSSGPVTVNSEVTPKPGYVRVGHNKSSKYIYELSVRDQAAQLLIRRRTELE
jgi:hypothetical protein